MVGTRSITSDKPVLMAVQAAVAALEPRIMVVQEQQDKGTMAVEVPVLLLAVVVVQVQQAQQARNLLVETQGTAVQGHPLLFPVLLRLMRAAEVAAVAVMAVVAAQEELAVEVQEELETFQQPHLLGP